MQSSWRLLANFAGSDEELFPYLSLIKSIEESLNEKKKHLLHKIEFIQGIDWNFDEQSQVRRQMGRIFSKREH
jgi:ATP-dependent protease HslVU (ClpYQ) peptidase subunit